MIRRLTVPLVTDTSGAGTLFSSAIMGTLAAILYKPGTLATGTDITITSGDNNKPILTKADAGTAAVWFYPRDLVHGVADGAALTGTSGGDRAEPLCDGRFKIVLAQGGGATTDGSITFYVRQ
jgi:hypothetical protein